MISQNNFREKFKAFAKEQKLLAADEMFLITVSGGVDSVVLAHICKQLGFSFVIVHCNFQLRGEASDGDENFVQALAKALDVPFYCKRFDTLSYKKNQGVGTQVAARTLRYDYFAELAESVAEEHKCKVKILTAHHQDDNVETSLMYMFRGSGIKGFTGIAVKNGIIERPLLFASKTEIKEFAGVNNIAYREDASNASDDYSRNFIRNKILPTIEEQFPDVKQMLVKDIELFQDVNRIYQIGIQKKIKSLVKYESGSIKIPVLRLEKMEAGKACLHEILQPLGFTAAQEIEVWQLCQSETGKYVIGKHHRVIRNRNWLVIVPSVVEEANQIVIESANESVNFAHGTLTLQTTDDVRIIADKQIALLDSRLLKFPLILRKWQQGDYFYPLGMNKKKKLSRFFIDEKLALHEKENVWVLESDGKIIWIVGSRIDDRFKMKSSSKAALRIKFDLLSK
jgi:tRNA(Ile)-lysidine synthase